MYYFADNIRSGPKINPYGIPITSLVQHENSAFTLILSFSFGLIRSLKFIHINYTDVCFIWTECSM